MISGSLIGQEEGTRRDAEIKVSKVPNIRRLEMKRGSVLLVTVTVQLCVSCVEEARLYSQRGHFKRAAADRRHPG